MRTILVSVLCLSVISAFGADQDKNKKKRGEQGGPPPGHQQHNATTRHLHKGSVSPLTGQPSSNPQPMIHHQHNLQGARKDTNITNKTLNKTFNENVTKNITKTQHFNLAKNPNPSIPAAKFQSIHIQNSQTWIGPRYVVFRNYVPVWHDQIWWVGHHSSFVFVFGAPYYWDAGYWYPAWGYYPGATYYYEGPIYAASPAVDPAEMVANVQSKLQEQGYYQGEIDGVLGPQTRAAIASYQADHGLYTTSAIDEPTLESLDLT